EVPEKGESEGRQRQENADAAVRPAAAMPLQPANDAVRAVNDTARAELRLFDQIPHALVLRKPGGACLANGEFLRLTGYASCGEFIRAGGFDTLFGDPRRMEGEEPPARQRLVLRTRDKGERPCEAVLKTVDWEGEKALL